MSGLFFHTVFVGDFYRLYLEEHLGMTTTNFETGDTSVIDERPGCLTTSTPAATPTPTVTCATATSLTDHLTHLAIPDMRAEM